MWHRALMPRWLPWVLGLLGLLALVPSARADDLPEYRLKAAFVYNFLVFTEWPADVGGTLNLCIVGNDPFGKEIDGLQGKAAAGRTIALHRRASGEPLRDCQAVFIAAPAGDKLSRLVEGLKGHPVLTMADSAGAMQQGVALNMVVVQSKVAFEVNLQAARSARLTLSSKLLRLATEVQQ